MLRATSNAQPTNQPPLPMKPLIRSGALTALLTLLSLPVFAQGTAFTYQGLLNDDASPANGSYDLRFTIYDALTVGNQQGSLITCSATAVSNGLFTVTLDFGDQFPGANRWLEIAVRTNGAGVFTNLSPRQPLTPVPYAVFAASAATASSAASVAAANITGTIPLTQLPPSVVTNGASGVNITGTFSGNGVGVSNVNLALNTAGSIRPPGGTFFLKSSPAVGNNPRSVTAADLNGDGKPDLITANTGANTLSILTNNGNGGFGLVSSLFVGNGPNSVTSADVNLDGKMDVICANFGAGTGNSLSVYTNKGGALFALAATLVVGTAPDAVTSADVNGDGRPDLISANFGTGQGTNLTVLTNNGTGGFVVASLPMVGIQPVSIAASDVNGDGRPDLISANSLSGTLTVLTNNGGGNFVLSSSPSIGATPSVVTAVDVNGDGKVDLISDSLANSLLIVLTNNGSGNFAPFFSATDDGISSIAAADVNGDGKSDLICTHLNDNTLTVWTNSGSSGFMLAAPLGGSGSGGKYSVTTADMNGDGKPDLISADGLNNTLSLWFNGYEFDGVFSGTFLGSGQFSTASFGASLSQKLNLYGLSYGIGIQNSVLYSRGSAFAWYAGGVHNDNVLNAGGGATLMTLTTSGLVVNGTFVSASDRNLKQDFSEVDSRSVLEKVAQLPIHTWVYKNDPNTKHLGPMAQDFYAAFAVGPDDKHITTVDESGVALAAIQGLNQKLEEQRAENVELKARLEKLEQRLDHKLNGGAK